MKFKILASTVDAKKVESSLMNALKSNELVSLKTKSGNLTGCEFLMVGLDIRFDIENSGQTEFEVTMQQINFNGVKL